MSHACLPVHQLYFALLFLCCGIESAVIACWFLILCHVKPKTSFLKYCIRAGVWEENESIEGWKPKDKLASSETDMKTWKCVDLPSNICRCYSTERVVWHSGFYWLESTLLEPLWQTALLMCFFFLAFRIHRMGQLVKGFVCSLQWLKRCKI